ncbi:MAG: hypothetical protein JKY65_05805 [Planctomycetes bacterium]|nr:hypothetical protein [Planctomycetota bacterium]
MRSGKTPGESPGQSPEAEEADRRGDEIHDSVLVGPIEGGDVRVERQRGLMAKPG